MYREEFRDYGKWDGESCEQSRSFIIQIDQCITPPLHYMPPQRNVLNWEGTKILRYPLQLGTLFLLPDVVPLCGTLMIWGEFVCDPIIIIIVIAIEAFPNIVIFNFQPPHLRVKKIFVGGLKPETTDQQIRDYFGSTYAPVRM